MPRINPRSVEVSGMALGSVMDAFALFPGMARRLFTRHGLIREASGQPIAFDRSGWYPLPAVLATYEDLAKEVGGATIFAVGKHIPQHAAFPPTVTDLDSAIRSIDVAYHMNHRLDGVPMYDPTTGRKAEGIGHYGYKRLAGERRIVSVCDNPYPCDFDRGIVTAMAQRFEPRARVVHDDSASCRKTGGDSCTIVITW